MQFHVPHKTALTRRRFQKPPADGVLGESAERNLAIDGGITWNAEDHAQLPIRRIVLTGGPGSGKSTAASFLAREFTGELWVLPESATLMYRGGLPRGDSDRGKEIAQRSIFATQRSLELAHAEHQPERVQVCDRGTVDGAAYWPRSNEHFFATMGTTHAAELLRYDAVIFMHTAAMLPAGYERDLDVRTEDRELAIELDQRVFDLYRDHPRLISIESSGSFLDKLVRVHAAVESLLRGRAVPTPSIERELVAH